MKFFYLIVIFGLLFFALLSSGCTSTTPPVQQATPVQTPTSVPMTAVATLFPTSTAVPYPNALALGEYASFGTGDQQGNATVYKYQIKSSYNWTAPSFNSATEQSSTAGPSGVQQGFNNAKPLAGDAFLFIYVRVANTGNKAVYAPSAQQFVVNFDGKAYNYTSVHSSDVVIDTVFGTQYDYQIGRGGAVGYVLPGDSNSADGFLIYEVPATFSPERTYVVSNLDFKTQAVWKLA
jgi:hypothetical protein